MAIQYSGTAQILNYSSGSSTPATDVETNLVAGMVSAGWTNTAVPASDTLTFSNQPAASSTFTLDNSPSNQTYTFVSSSPTGNQILIDTNLANTISNAFNALNAGPGAGTKYGSALTQPPNMVASGHTGTTLTVSYKTGGSAGNGAAATTSGTINATWGSSTLGGGFNNLLTAITPQGLQCSVDIHTTSGSFYNPGTTLVVKPGNRYRTVISPSTISDGSPSAPPGSTNWKLVADKYQFFNFIPGTSNSQLAGNGIGAGVPFLTSNLQAPTIVSATNAAPIVCNIPSHGYTTGQTVLVVGGLGNTAVNGQTTVTVIDTNNFSLDATTGNGTYTANSAYCANLTIGTTVVEAIWSSGTNGGAPANLRNNVAVGNGGWTNVNNQTLSNDGSSAEFQMVVSVTNSEAIANNLQWYDNSYVIHEPFMAWGISNGAEPKLIGQMWDAVIIRVGLTPDQTATFDSPPHNWIAAGLGPNVNLLLATS